MLNVLTIHSRTNIRSQKKKKMIMEKGCTLEMSCSYKVWYKSAAGSHGVFLQMHILRGWNQISGFIKYEVGYGQQSGLLKKEEESISRSSCSQRLAQLQRLTRRRPLYIFLSKDESMWSTYVAARMVHCVFIILTWEPKQNSCYLPLIRHLIGTQMVWGKDS